MNACNRPINSNSAIRNFKRFNMHSGHFIRTLYHVLRGNLRGNSICFPDCFPIAEYHCFWPHDCLTCKCSITLLTLQDHCTDCVHTLRGACTEAPSNHAHVLQISLKTQKLKSNTAGIPMPKQPRYTAGIPILRAHIAWRVH